MVTHRPEKKPDGHAGDSDKILCRDAKHAAEMICAAGLMRRQGQIGPGTNNLTANSYAGEFTKADLRRLSHCDERSKGFGQIIGLRQQFMALSSEDQCWGSTPGMRILQKIADQLEKLKTLGWKPKEKCINLNPK